MKTNLPPLMVWTTKSWWKYLLEKPMYSWHDSCKLITIIKVMWCRANGHLCGPVYYNPSGLEPDDTCIDCGDHLG